MFSLFRMYKIFAVCFGFIPMLAFYGEVYTQTIPKVWDKCFGGSSADGASAVVPAVGGGCLVLGYTASPVSGDKTEDSRGNRDYWVVKVDGSGNKVWDKSFGGTMRDQPSAITPAVGGGYIIVGSSASGVSGDKTEASRGQDDVWIVKIDENGTTLWDKTFGGQFPDYASAITPVQGGGYIVAGYSTSGISGDKSETTQGGYDYWVVKIDENGNKIWDKTFGGSAADVATGVTSVPSGGCIVVGYSESGASGNKTSDSRGNRDYWLVKIDGNGTKVWDKTFGGSNFDEAYSITAATGGAYLVAGYSASGVSEDITWESKGDTDFWVLKIDENGNKIWDKRYGGQGQDNPRSILANHDGSSYLVAGYSRSSLGGDKTQASKGDWDYWVLGIDENGTKLWDQTLGGNRADAGGSLALGTGNDLFVAGESYSGNTGDKTQESQGERDFWVIKLALPGASSRNTMQTADFILYPTFTQGLITARFNALSESTESVQVRDLSGRIVASQILKLIPGYNEFSLDLANQPMGVYSIQVLGHVAKVILAK
jgi:hypothetical protein